MMNLKKTLAVVLAFAMILSMGLTSMAAYSDVTAGTVVSEAVDILSGLNILTGFEDGTFKPDETVTRAQMAAIICRTLGYEDQAQSSMGTTVFNDVAADHWASGYINVAQAQQIINGYGDGNYGPEDKVTYEQAVKMIVSALGYDIAATAKGGYPTGYLAIASAEGITKSANGKVGDAATRGTIAVLVYNALEVRLMDQNSWSTDGTDTYGKDNKNILTNYLDVVKVEGIVTDNALTEVAGYTYQADAESNVTIDGYGWIFDQYNTQGYSEYKKVALSQVDALDNDNEFDASHVDVAGLLGKYVIAYVGEDEVTGKNTVLAIAESKSKNDSLKISATQLVEAGQKYDTEAGVIGYTEVGASRIKDLKLDAAVKVYKNYDEIAAVNTTAALRTKLPNGGIVEFISNDADSDIEYIVITAYDKETVIEKVEEVNGTYRYETYTAVSLDKIDVEDEDKLFVVYKDGVAATAADLAVNDTVSCVKVAKNFWIYYASSATVTGMVEAYSTDDATVTIAGTDYEVTNAYYYDHDSNGSTPEIANVKKLSGEEGIFFLNVDGKIAHNETAPTSVGKYALITALYKETKVGTAVDYITAVLADGTVAEYELDDQAELQDAAGTQINASLKTALEAALTEDATVNGETVHRANTGDITNSTRAKNLLVKLSVNGSGKVTKARTLEGSVGTASSDKYDETSFSVGGVDFQEDAVIFSVKTPVGHSYIDADDVKVGTLATFFADEETYSLLAFDEDDSIFGAGLGVDLAKAIAVDSSVFVVSSKKTITYNDDDAYVVTGMIAGEDKTITIYNEDNAGIMSAAGTLVAGDVILISEPDAEGIVSDIQKLVAFDKSNPSAVVPTTTAGVVANDEIASGYGYLTSATNSKFVLGGTYADVKYDHLVSSARPDWANDANGISYKSANYTLVDFSENNKTPELVAETAGKSLFDTAYVTYVYVRVVEDRVADVVVYRMGDNELTVSANEVGAGDATITFTATTGATVTVLDADTDAADVVLTPNGNKVDVTGTALAEGDEITVEVKVQKTGYTDYVTTLVIEVVA